MWVIKLLGSAEQYRGWAVHIAANGAATSGQIPDIASVGSLLDQCPDMDYGVCTAAVTYDWPDALRAPLQRYCNRRANRNFILDILRDGVPICGVNAPHVCRIPAGGTCRFGAPKACGAAYAKPPRFVYARAPEAIYQLLDVRWPFLEFRKFIAHRGAGVDTELLRKARPLILPSLNAAIDVAAVEQLFGEVARGDLRRLEEACKLRRREKQTGSGDPRFTAADAEFVRDIVLAAAGVSQTRRRR